MWHFRNDEMEFSYNPFKKKSKFDPKRKDAAIELYLSRLEEEISSLDYKVGYSNLTKGERDAIYSLKNDSSIIIKEADKGSAVVVWDRDDYLKQKNNLTIKMFKKNLLEMWKVLLKKSSKPKNSEIREILATTHWIIFSFISLN